MPSGQETGVGLFYTPEPDGGLLQDSIVSVDIKMQIKKKAFITNVIYISATKPQIGECAVNE